MIYDCFPFFNELDIIEIRFKELYDHVDYFVISESCLTHSGNPKPLYFQENQARFSNFSDKIIHVICNDPTSPIKGDDMNWTREKNQRNFIYQALKEVCKDEDIIITSDTDEIVSADKIAEIKQVKEMVSLEMKPSWYYLNLISDPPWNVAKALPFWVLKNHFHCDLSQVRLAGAANCIKNSGWHFSYMGGRERVLHKMESFAHQEFNSEKYKNERQLDLVIRFGSSIWDEFKEIAPRGDIPYWKYVDPTQYLLPTCVQNGEYNHMLSEVRFKYDYDCGNLYHLFNLTKDFLGEGEVIDIGCKDGRSSVYLANALPNNKIYCLGVDDQFETNMRSLTNGNFEIVDNDFLKNLDKPIKVLHINDGNLKEIIGVVLSKLSDSYIICGYNFQQNKNILEEIFPEINSSGEFWFSKKER